MAASSSSTTGSRYDVFLSFRGEDTRRSFVCHLKRALESKFIKTFIDSKDLAKGDRISELLNCIDNSKLSVVVLSENYASSTWCLRELVKILECQDIKQHIVVPIFYQVDPSHVRGLSGKFAQAFDQHKADSKIDEEQLASWMSAMTRVGGISGWDSLKYEDDGKLIDEVVEDIRKKVIRTSPNKFSDLVRMESHIAEMDSRLCLWKKDIRLVVGIWGMGGLGKTTIARAVFDEIAIEFEHSCFLYNVKEAFISDHVADLQEKLLSTLLKEQVKSIGLIENRNMILERLGTKKVLIVLDDVENTYQIKELMGDPHSSVGLGSRIIVTTRNFESLSGNFVLYKPKHLEHEDALQLFMKHAFTTNQPSGEYNDLSERVLEYAQGLPLALTVLGCFLDKKNVHEWEPVLEKLKKFPHKEIQHVLKTSYDGLDDSQQNIFLDIACHFRGWEKDSVARFLDSCGFFPGDGLKVLLDRALITISRENKLDMHDLLQEMGREIVRLQSLKQPGKRSRLWNYDDIIPVVTQNQVADSVECLVLDLLNSKVDICINAEAFNGMKNLRLLMIHYKQISTFDDEQHPIFKFYDSFEPIVGGCKQHVKEDMVFLSQELRILIWHRCPMKSLPSDFIPTNLVQLDLHDSQILQLWEGKKPLKNLKVIILSFCEFLIKIPDLTEATKLERLILSGCSSLLEVHPSISSLQNLVGLNLGKCTKLKILPSIIDMKCLNFLDLSGCTNLEKFPKILEVMEKLELLNLSGTAIKELCSINNLPGLLILELKDCTELRTLPHSIYFKSLHNLDLCGCTNLEKFPEISEVMEELVDLDLSGTAIKELPSSINNLTCLHDLQLKGCTELRTLPHSIYFKSLEKINLCGCTNLEKFPDISEVMEKLRYLDLSGTAIKELPSSINNLTCLHDLKLKGCTELRTLPHSIYFKSLQILDLCGCTNLEKFPEISEVMEELRYLYLSGTAIKELPSSINNLTGLVDLNLKGCTELRTLPHSIYFKSLQILGLCGCTNVEKFPDISEVKEELDCLDLSGTAIKELPSSINNLTGLVDLNLKDCTELRTLPHSIYFKSLQNLDLCGCTNLEKFPEISEVMEELVDLDLSGTAIKELPSSINNLTCLHDLQLKGCTELRTLPHSIYFKSLEKINLCGCTNLEKFPDISEVMEELESLDLSGTAIKELPSSINNLTGLVDLNLKDCTELRTLPHSIYFKSLQSLVLCGCTNLEMFPDISEVMEELESLNVSGIVIKELPSSINNLTGLVDLILTDCTELRTLPHSVYFKSLHNLDLCGCTNLEKFPEISEVMEELRYLYLSGTAIKELPSSINNLTGLVGLNLKDCTELRTLPHSIYFKSLQNLDLCGCTNLEKFPEISEVMEKLRYLDLSGTAIKELPSSINNLTCLHYLKLKGCTELRILPHSIYFKSLQSLDLCGCTNLEMFPDISEVMEELESLDLSGTAIKELPSSINNLTGLVDLNLIDCTELKTLPHSIYFKSLQSLVLCGCTNLEMFPDISEVMEELESLDVSGIVIKELPSSINNLTGLVDLILTDCTELRTLPHSVYFKSLHNLDLCGCTNLEKFPEISEVMEELRYLYLGGTAIKELPSSINNLTGLVGLNLKDCTELRTLPHSIYFKSLQNLDLCGCTNLKKFPEISEVMEKLRYLDLSGTAIKELPSSINNLTCLHDLKLKGCTELRTLPHSIYFKSLQILDLCGCTNLEKFPEISEVMEELRYLYLSGTAIKELPSSINNLTGLVDLNLKGCTELRTLPHSIYFKSLQILGLCGCTNVEKFPDISEVKEELDCLDLSGTAIKELPSSINNLTGLVDLNLKDCTELRTLPHSIYFKSLEKINLCGCTNLEKFPEISEVMEELVDLDLSGTAIKELPSSINNLTCLHDLQLKGCTELRTLPHSIYFKSLEKINLCGCTNLEKFPDISEVMEELESLDLSGTAIKELPSSINNLTGLVDLNLKDCTELRTLPHSIYFKSLQSLDLCGCTNLEKFPDISEVMEELESLDLSGTAIKELPSSINNLTGLVDLNLKDCTELRTLPHSIYFKSLIVLDISGCTNLEKFPEISEVMKELGYLDVSGIAIKELPSSINNLTCLVDLNLKDCTELRTLPHSIYFKSLQNLDLCGCTNLEKFPEISEVMEKLRYLDLSGTAIKELPSSINNLTCLHDLKLKGCTELRILPHSIYFKSLQSLDLCGCTNLEMFPDISEVMEELESLDLSGTAIKELPSSINNLTGLVDLNLKDCTELKTLPHSIYFKSLQSLVLCGCTNLEMFPDISEVMEELESLDVSGIVIKELPSSINNLTGLYLLNLKDCTELRTLPHSIYFGSLQRLDLCGCTNLEEFPEISEVMEKLGYLDLSGTAIKELHSSINNLTGLRYLLLKDCTKLESLPSSIHLKFLETLNLVGCSNLRKFSEISGIMINLKELHLDETAIEELHSSIDLLQGLQTLSLRNCRSLVCLSNNICNLARLRHVYLSGCSKLLSLPDNFEDLVTLVELDVQDSGIKQLSLFMLFSAWLPPANWHLQHLDLSYSNLLVLPDVITDLSSLECLKLCRNNFESLPATMNRLCHLKVLKLNVCKRLKSIPELSPSVNHIDAHDCMALETVSEPHHPYPESLSYTFTNCFQLVQKNLFRDIVESYILHNQDNCMRYLQLKMSLPGSEVPEWFKHKGAGFSVSVRLQPNWSTNGFMGFAVCAIRKREICLYRYMNISIACLCTFKGVHGECSFHFDLVNSAFSKDKIFDSDHMIMGYVSWSKCHFIEERKLINETYTEATFEIVVVCDRSETQLCIESCGVRFIYAADQDEVQNQSMIQSHESQDHVTSCGVDAASMDLFEIREVETRREEIIEPLWEVEASESGERRETQLPVCCCLSLSACTHACS